MMAAAMRAEGMELTHIIGPQTKHAYHPLAKQEVSRWDYFLYYKALMRPRLRAVPSPDPIIPSRAAAMPLPIWIFCVACRWTVIWR